MSAVLEQEPTIPTSAPAAKPNPLTDIPLSTFRHAGKVFEAFLHVPTDSNGEVLRGNFKQASQQVSYTNEAAFLGAIENGTYQYGQPALMPAELVDSPKNASTTTLRGAIHAKAFRGVKEAVMKVGGLVHIMPQTQEEANAPTVLCSRLLTGNRTTRAANDHLSAPLVAVVLYPYTPPAP